MADHVLDRAILRRLLAQPLDDGEVILAADFGIDENALVDLDDVTKVLANNQQLVKIGKQLSTYSAFDTGAFLCSPHIFSALDESAKAGDRSVSGAIRRLAVRGKAKVIDVRDHRWLDVDTPQDLRNAERLLFQNLSKPADGFISRRISTAIFTPLLLKLSRRMTANLVSLLVFFVSFGGSLTFFLGLPTELASLWRRSEGVIHF